MSGLFHWKQDHSITSMKFLFLIIALGSFIYLLFKVYQKSEGGLRPYFHYGLTYKLMAGVLFGSVYIYGYREGDTLLFFNEASRLFEIFYYDPFKYLKVISDSSIVGIPDRRTAFFINFISIINLFSFNNYWVLTAYLSVISFISLWLLIQRIVRSYRVHPLAALVGFIFFPSLTFWTSGLIKETVSISAMSLIILQVIPLLKGKKVTFTGSVVGISALLVLTQLKYYHAAALIIVLVPLVFWKILMGWIKDTRLRWVSFASVVLITILTTSTLHYNLDTSRVSKIIVENNKATADISDPEKIIRYYDLEPTLGSLLINVPIALFNGLFKPLPWDSWNWMSFLGSMENLMLLMLVAHSLYYKGGQLINQKEEVYALIIYIVIMTIALALSTPNYGTLSRYKVAFLPFLLLMVFNNLLQVKSIKRFVRIDRGS